MTLSTTDNKSCEKASAAAFEIFKLALRLNNDMYDFEQEREVLRKFRLGLREMIEKREKKLKALTAQLKALMAAWLMLPVRSRPCNRKCLFTTEY